MPSELVLPIALIAGLFGLFGLLYLAKYLLRNVTDLPGPILASVELVPGEWAALAFDVQPAKTTLWLELAVEGDALPGYSSGATVALRVTAGERVLAEHPGFHINSHHKGFSPYGGVKINVSGGSTTYYRCTAALLSIQEPPGTAIVAHVCVTPYQQLTPNTLRLFAAHEG